MRDRDYVLGTGDDEIARLRAQHEAWLPTASACWRRAGISRGHKVIDIGAGPGFASFDIARLVGEGGSVTAVERSTRFVEAGRKIARHEGWGNVRFHETDLMTDRLPGSDYDMAWCRWVASFVESPAVLAERIAAVVRAGGVAAFHEYADYASWRFSPSLPLVDEFIALTMKSWRDAGGEPDVATRLPPLLDAHGFTIEHVKPHVFCVRPGHPLWNWIAAFVESNSARLVELETLTPKAAEAMLHQFRDAQSTPSSLMLTPMVLEIVAAKRGA